MPSHLPAETRKRAVFSVSVPPGRAGPEMSETGVTYRWLAELDAAEAREAREARTGGSGGCPDLAWPECWPRGPPRRLGLSRPFSPEIAVRRCAVGRPSGRWPAPPRPAAA